MLSRRGRMHVPTAHDVAMARTMRTGEAAPHVGSPWFWMRHGGALRRDARPRPTSRRSATLANGSTGKGGR